MEEGKENRDNIIVSAEFQAIEKITKEFDPQDIPQIDPRNEKILKFVVDCSQLFGELYQSLVNRFDDDQLKTFDTRIANIQHTPTKKLLTDISKFFEKRKKLIDALKLSSKKLDDSFVITTIGRLFVSLIDLIDNFDSAFDKQISKSLIEEAYKYSRNFGLASHIVFAFISFSKYLGFVPELWDIMFSRWTLRDVVKASHEDMQSYEQIQNWLDETIEMHNDVRELFSNGFDCSIVKEIDKVYKNYDICTKVFATVFISMLESNSSIVNDTKGLCEILMFSRSEVGEEWYNRTLKVDHPISFLETKLNFRKKLMSVAKNAPEVSIDLIKILPHIRIYHTDPNDPNTAVKTAIKFKLKPIPYFVLGMINFFTICSCCVQLKDGVRHSSSDYLKTLSDKAELNFKQIEKQVEKLK